MILLAPEAGERNIELLGDLADILRGAGLVFSGSAVDQQVDMVAGTRFNLYRTNPNSS